MPSIENAMSGDRNSSWQTAMEDTAIAPFARERAFQEAIADGAMDQAYSTFREETQFVKEATQAAAVEED